MSEVKVMPGIYVFFSTLQPAGKAEGRNATVRPNIKKNRKAARFRAPAGHLFLKCNEDPKNT